MEGGDLSLCCGVSPQTLLPGGGARHAGDNTLQVCHDLTSSESEVTNMKIDIEIDRKWQKGECIIPSDCAFRHYYTEEDEQVEEVIYILPIPHISILNYVSV